MDRFPLLFGGRAVGELTTEWEGLYLCFSAVCRLPEEGLWSVWAVGDQGDLRLGILEPSSGRYVLRRRFSGQMTASVGRILRGEVRGTERGAETWSLAAYPERLFRTPWLREQLRGMKGVLADGRGRRRVAIPYDPERPFPLAAMFCFARICRIGEGLYTVYCFDGCEWPVL